MSSQPGFSPSPSSLPSSALRRGYPSSLPPVQNDRLLAALSALLGVVLVVIGITYLALDEHKIPSFFPGHVSHPASHHHVKHGIAAILLGLACFAFAWFRLGPRKRAVPSA
jgi:hypothetical protein